MSRARKNIASITALAVLAAVPATVAILHDGFPITDVDLQARKVWVTNGEQQLAGRVNRQIEELDGAVAALTSAVDVLQNGDDVYLYDPSLGRVDGVDPAFLDLAESIEVPAGSSVAYGASTLAVLAPGGELWVGDVAGALDLDAAGSAPDLELGPGARVTVSADGTVFATSVTDRALYTIDGEGAEPRRSDTPALGVHELTAVGNRPVILDTDNDQLLIDGSTVVDLPRPGIRLQQVGAANDAVLVAAGDALLSVPLNGDDIVVHETGAPAAAATADGVSAPVWLNGCAHAAWSSLQSYLYDCGDGVEVRQIPKSTAGTVLEFRVNRDVIALNNLTNGDVWLIDADMRLVENWDEVTPPEQEETEEGEEKSSQQSFEDTLAERTEQNRPPVARDDEFGVRPGSATVLPVLDNDTDPDGDVLVVTRVSGIDDSWGDLAFIDGGRALQISPSEGARGSVSFRYTVSDGRPGGVAEAQVTLRLRPMEENVAPVAFRSAAVSVEEGQKISYNVLADWIDPDGDDIFLVSAAPSTGDVVTSSPDGYINFEHRTGELGLKEVTFVVSDGRLTAAGVLTIDVKKAGSLNPVGTPDFARTYVGEPVLIQPLANDLSPSGATLVLRGIAEAPADVQAVPNLTRGEITFSAPVAGTYYLIYVVGAGANDSVGIIRIDVEEDPDDIRPPIAVKDIGYVRAGEPTTINVLANDVSPGGRVLAIQSVDTSSAGGLLAIEVLGHQQIRVTASTALTEQVQFRYTVSDGLGSAVAGVTVIPVPPLVKHQPPVAVDDPINVRAGDIVSVPVLDNDFHPDAVQFELEPELLRVEGVGRGVAFVTGDEVRFQAPDEPGVARVSYRIFDRYGETSTADVVFTIVADDADNNRGPLPIPITGRVIAGSSVTVEVPLDGIDPDGDSVVLLGITSAPTLGRVIETTSTSITYEAYPNSAGTDRFRYRVQDTYGLTEVGTIDIGVIPPPTNAMPPTAVDDTVEVPPGRTVSVPVLANDSDPNGFVVSLDRLLEVDDALTAEIERGQLVVTAPDVEGGYTIRYQITNNQGGVDSAFLQVMVTDEARIAHPTAIDHVIEPQQLVGEDSVVLDLREGAVNPGGRVGDLVISLHGPNAGQATILEDGTVRVVPDRWRSAIAYSLTNEIDELSASAFIIVPPAGSDAETFPPPYLDPTLPEQIVDMNGSGSWELENILIVPSGQKAIITDVSTVSATNSTGVSPYVDNDTIRFEPREDYRGGASITFEVTDGETADDPTGRKAWITLPITVGDPDFEDFPPSFTTQNVTIEAGEDPLVIDLRDSSDHPNPRILAELEYVGFAGATADISASLGGSQVTISAARGVQPGTRTTLSFTVHYGDFEIPGTVEVTTVSSTRPLAQPADDHVVLLRGQSVSVPVLANDFNPFAASDEPLQLIDARIINDASGASLSFSEATDEVTVTANASFIGDVAVVYTVQDATLDPARNVQGSLVVTVEDRPDRPAAPEILAEADREVQLRFTAPASNGNPIDLYRITWTGGGQLDVGAAGTHTITGLTNATNYTFQVMAQNGHGWSVVSAASPVARPFTNPSVVPSVSISATSNGSGNVTVTWGSANGNGRDITNYVVRLNDGTEQTVGVTNSTTFTGMAIGTNYSATVVARNGGGLSSPTPGQSSNSATPRPGPVTSLAASATSNGDGRVTFTWGVPGGQGASSYNWTVTKSGGNNCSAGMSGTTTSRQLVCVGSPGATYTISVTAEMGGAVSDARTASARPTAPPPPNPRTAIVGKSAATYSCDNGSYTCKRAAVQFYDITPGQYTITMQTDYGWTSSHPATITASSGTVALTQGYLATLAAGNHVRVIVTGPSGDISTPWYTRDQWANMSASY